MMRPDHAWIFFTVLLSLALAMSIPPRQAESEGGGFGTIPRAVNSLADMVPPDGWIFGSRWAGPRNDSTGM